MKRFGLLVLILAPAIAHADTAVLIDSDGSLRAAAAALQIDVLTKAFYATHDDKYDFINFYFKGGAPGALTLSWTAQNPDQGMLIPATADVSASLGSGGRLLGGMLDAFDFRKSYIERGPTNYPWDLLNNFYFGVEFHEMVHRWGVALPPPVNDACDGGVGDSPCTSPHWKNYSGSWVGVDHNPLQRLRPDGRGGYEFVFGCAVIPKLHQFDMYSAGFLGKTDVTDVMVVAKPGIFPKTSPQCESTFPANSGDVIAHTLDDMIAAVGQRSPSVALAKKDFTVASVLIVQGGDPAQPDELAALTWIDGHFPLAWYRATDGRSRLNGVVPSDNTPPSVLDLSASATSSSVSVRFHTDEPAAAFLVYDPPDFPSIEWPQVYTTPPLYTTDHAITVTNAPASPIVAGTSYPLHVIVIDAQYNIAGYPAGTITAVDAPDAGTPDAPMPDAGTPDAPMPDAGTPDAPMPDAGTPDAPMPDAGTPDAPIDARRLRGRWTRAAPTRRRVEGLGWGLCLLGRAARGGARPGPVVGRLHAASVALEDKGGSGRHLGSRNGKCHVIQVATAAPASSRAGRKRSWRASWSALSSRPWPSPRLILASATRPSASTRTRTSTSPSMPRRRASSG
jgi:hypothetical protein